HEKPQVYEFDSIKKVIIEITHKRLGATVVLNENNHIKGIITDGDIRRMLEKNTDFNKMSAQDIMNTQPKTIDVDDLAVNALEVMRNHNISQLVVTSGETYMGMVHIHDLINEGIH
ncbi:MAG TPA: CBS domain-containing protein, partial [Chitinophagaceae bacterium]|nr:CBS domain-containing protein [Chitinophagaceae bacterium]